MMKLIFWIVWFCSSFNLGWHLVTIHVKMALSLEFPWG